MEGYRILEIVGKGSQGTVHRVNRKLDDEEYILKKIVVRDEVDLNHAVTEAELLENLAHPFIATCVDTFSYQNSHETALCMVMEYCRNGDLAKMVKRRKR